MERRTFIKLLGGSLTVPYVGSTASCSANNSDDTLSVKVFQTKRLEQKQSNVYTHSTKIQEEIAPTIENSLSSLIDESTTTVNVTIAENAVSTVNHTIDSEDDLPARFAHNVLWSTIGTTDPRVNPATHSNLLLDVADAHTKRKFGIGWFGILPSCGYSADRFSSAYLGQAVFEGKTQFDEIARIALHEIGHNLGLKHKHGCVLYDKSDAYKSIMYSDRYMRNNDTNMFGEKLMLVALTKNEFNPKLSSEYITW